ncbi:hypothetical protein YTPLAS18_37920 [Nitrospira sp.]|nr:hypothetical protein YTPLAS18_37920 [Nitrospira sp.]
MGDAMSDLQASTLFCPICRAERDQLSDECRQCGIIFAKYKPLPRPSAPTVHAVALQVPDRTGWIGGLWLDLKRLAFAVDESTSPVVLGGRAVAFVVLLVWGWKLMSASIASNYVGESFMHLINLPFHEAGHIFFTPLGRFLQVIGGSLGQLMMPLICVGAFLIQQRNPFGASVSLWWCGESLLDLAPYIDDARALDLVLIGGVTGKDVEDYHDWEYILRTVGWLQYDHLVATIAHRMGTALMVGALVWAAWLLIQQSKRLG